MDCFGTKLRERSKTETGSSCERSASLDGPFNDHPRRGFSAITVYYEVYCNVYHMKKGNQHARKADMMMPNVRAAFLSRFILLLEAAGRKAPESGSVSTSTSFTASDVDSAPRALMPLICKCLFSNAAATLLLKGKEKSNQKP